jgi:thioredoxin 1
MKSLALLLVLMLFSVAIPGTGKTGTTEIVPDIPAKNTVTMVDLGAKTCIPCKLMAPILEELEKEYKGRAAVIFIDVLQYQPRFSTTNRGKRSIVISVFSTRIRSRKNLMLS